ncbi:MULTISPECIES: alpha/beta fold hydrolase [Clostridium]|uniref:alpha/beta fold hydrolase n=1 Tax=Clostridium TaxID=1485 RepID=UPI000825685F|nr:MULTISPECIES: alpha/beta hydrolase [Clostridium]PJI07545.1 alpha/beta hydrolase [Clostridium sp. CT7]
MLNYVQAGNNKSSKTLLFIHGAASNHRVYGEVQKYLEDYNCILIDLNGHGDSKGPCSPTIEGYIDNVTDFIKNSDVTKNQNDITIIGYSMGGATVLGIALKKLHNVKRGVVISGTSKFNKLKDTEFIKKIYEKHELDRECLRKYIGNQSNPLAIKYAHLGESNPELLMNNLVACSKFDISDKIKNIDIPVKILISRDEKLVLLECAERDNSRIKNSILTIFESGMHVLPIINGKGVAKEIAAFISD